MSQHDLVVDNGTGIVVRLDLNQALQALGSMELGTTAPVPTYACQRWADATTGLMKKRNTANTVWLPDGRLDVATAGGVPLGGAAGAILVKNSTADGDMIWSTATYFPATGGTISGNLGVAGTLTVSGASAFNNQMSVNAPLINSVNIQCNVPTGQNALYWMSVAGVRQWYLGVVAAGVFRIVDQSGGASRFQIDTLGTITIPGKLNCTLQDGIEITVPAGQYARFRSTVAGARTWDMGTYASGIFSIDDLTAGASRLSISTAGLVTVQGLSVIGALSIANLNTGAITASSIVASVNIQCNPASGGAWFYATAPGVREWQWGVQTDGSFWIFDTSGARTGLVIDTAGRVTIPQSLDVNGVIDVGAGGVLYTAFDTDRIAFRYNGSQSLALIVNSALVGSQVFNLSDERIKRNIAAPEGDALDELRRLEFISYDMPDRIDPKLPAAHVRVGFSAQKMGRVIPEAVTKSPKDALDPARDYEAQPYTEDELLLGIDTTPLVARCIVAIQQLATRIETLEGAKT